MKGLLKGLVVGIASLSTVVGITLATTMEVKAAEATLYDGEAVVTKEISIPAGVTVPNLTFEFEVEKLGVEDGVAPEGYVPDAQQPEWAIPSIEFSESGEEADKGQADNKAVKSTEDLMSTIKGLTFPHAGVYLYRVTEVDPKTTPDVIRHYSQAEYIVRVYVENKPGGGVDVKGITVLKEKEDNGDELNPAVKVDPTPGSGDYGGSEFRFVNDFWDETELEVEKEVVGKSADLTKAFDFEITVTFPETTKEDFKLNYTAPSETDPLSPIIYDGKNRVYKVKVKLKHGEKITFSNFPVGGTYQVVEKVAKGYTPSAEVTGKGTHGTAKAPIKDAAEYTVTIVEGVDEITNLLVDAKEGTTINKTTVTNELGDPSITGVITDNLPFILMILVAGAGIVFLTVSKRRRAN